MGGTRQPGPVPTPRSRVPLSVPDGREEPHSQKENGYPSVCRTAETRPPPSPFLCLDLTYISLLLQELGFPGDKVLKVGTLGCPLPAPQEHVPVFPTHVLLSLLVSSS